MRIACFDPLRALLAWWVVLIHVLWLSGYGMDGTGTLPVGTFIWMSGLVITLLLTQKKESYGLFLGRRAVRLFPVYLVALALTLPLRLYSPQTYDLSVLASEHRFFWQHLFAHLSLLHGVVPDVLLPHASAAFLSPAWSISTEWQFYLIAPLLVWLTLRHRRTAFLLFIASLAVLLPQINWRLYGYWSELGAFLPQKLYLFMGGALCARYAPALARLRVPFFAAPLGWLGQHSYPTYLIHVPLLLGVNLLIGTGQGWAHALLLFILGGPLIVAASVLLHRYIEVPMVALGKGLELWLK